MATVTARQQGYQGPTRSHADQREWREWVDQHGRLWGGEIEKKSGDFCGLPPQPIGWKPPFPEWMPPPTIMRCGRQYRIIEDDGTERNLGTEEMFLDYAPWKTATLDSLREWNELLFDIGRTMSGDAFDPANPTPQVLNRIGRKPLPLEPILAMEQGNRFALGLTTTPDPRLAPFMPLRRTMPTADFREPDFADMAPSSPKRGPGRPRKTVLLDEE